MARRLPLRYMDDVLGVEEDPLPIVGGREGNEVVPLVDIEGNILQEDEEDEGIALEATQRACVSIAEEIELEFDYTFDRIDGVPIAFPRPGDERPNFIWSWRKSWAFYEMKYRTLKEKCNRKSLTERETNPITLYLTHLWWCAKLRGRDHLSGSKLTIWPRHESRVSFGKRRHWENMRSGWSLARPTSLSQFDPEVNNILPEDWKTNSFRGFWSVRYVDQAVKLFVESEKEKDGSMVGDYHGLLIEDGYTAPPLPPPRRERAPTDEDIVPMPDPERGAEVIDLTKSDDDLASVIEISDDGGEDTNVEQPPYQSPSPSVSHPVQGTYSLTPANEAILNRVVSRIMDEVQPLTLLQSESGILDTARVFFNTDPSRRALIPALIGLLRAIRRPADPTDYPNQDDEDLYA